MLEQNHLNRHYTALIYFLFLILGLLCLYPALRGGFFYDDFDHMDGALRAQHAMRTGSGTFLNVFHYDFVLLDEGQYVHYRPGGYLVFSLMYWLKGAAAPWFILAGILGHVIVVGLFYRLALVLLNDWRKSFWAALLFLCQDWGIITVLWPGAAMFYLPFTICLLLILLLFMHYQRTSRKLWLYLSAVLLFAQYSFLEGAHITILILFAYYITTNPQINKRNIWWFFTRPLFYPYYVAILLWLLVLASQNIGASGLSILATFKYSFNFDALLRMFHQAIYVLSQETQRITGLSASSTTNLLITYAYFFAFILFTLTCLTVYVIKSVQQMRFIALWLVIECVPRFFFGSFSSRMFYTINFPLIIILVVAVFLIADKVTKRFHFRFAATSLATVLLLLVLTWQIIHLQVRIHNWNNIVANIKYETDQLFSQAGEINRGDYVVLMAPTFQQDEMLMKDHLRKRLQAYLKDYTVQVIYQPYDSSAAERLSRLPNYHVLVGTPNQYFAYYTGLDVAKLIPENLDEIYRRAHENIERGRKNRQEFLKRQKKP